MKKAFGQVCCIFAIGLFFMLLSACSKAPSQQIAFPTGSTSSIQVVSCQDLMKEMQVGALAEDYNIKSMIRTSKESFTLSCGDQITISSGGVRCEVVGEHPMILSRPPSRLKWVARPGASYEIAFRHGLFVVIHQESGDFVSNANIRYF